MRQERGSSTDRACTSTSRRTTTTNHHDERITTNASRRARQTAWTHLGVVAIARRRPAWPARAAGGAQRFRGRPHGPPRIPSGDTIISS
ncbi:MAG: hypothetical protein CL424_12315 [Acidimicrobiaceae bacterium]|nr:hypothetical protein [Acidimicrobiaceae bacterium]